MISILLQVTLFLGVTYDKCATYKFTIHQIGTHDNVLKELMSLVIILVFIFVWLVVNLSVNF